MSRAIGTLNIATVKFKELLAQECEVVGTNPVKVLMKLLKSRDPSMRLQAARVLLPFWFPVQRELKVDVPAQISLAWDDDADDAVLEHAQQPIDARRLN